MPNKQLKMANRFNIKLLYLLLSINILHNVSTIYVQSWLGTSAKRTNLMQGCPSQTDPHFFQVLWLQSLQGDRWLLEVSHNFSGLSNEHRMKYIHAYHHIIYYRCINLDKQHSVIGVDPNFLISVFCVSFKSRDQLKTTPWFLQLHCHHLTPPRSDFRPCSKWLQVYNGSAPSMQTIIQK